MKKRLQITKWSIFCGARGCEGGGTAGRRWHEDISFTSHRYYWRVTVHIYVTRKHAGSL